MGAVAILLRGDSHRVEHLHLRSNGGSGVTVINSADLGGSVVQHNTVQRNGSTGISLSRGVIADNTVNANKFIGITLNVGIVRNNFVNRHFSAMSLAGGVLYIGRCSTSAAASGW